jgi:hypothetical protein
VVTASSDPNWDVARTLPGHCSARFLRTSRVEVLSFCHLLGEILILEPRLNGKTLVLEG